MSSSLSHDELKAWWMNPSTYGTCLLALALDHWGTEVMEFEPETIRLELRGMFGSEPPQVNMDKLFGLISSMTSNLFYTNLESFTSICEALSNTESNFTLLEPLEPEECAWGIAEVTMNDEPEERGRESRDAQYSEDIRGYLGVILKQDGITKAPPILSIAEMGPGPGNDFSDDPAMVKAYYRRQDDETEEISTHVRMKTASLFRQLEKLPLRNRDPKTWSTLYAKAAQRLGLLTPEEPDL